MNNFPVLYKRTNTNKIQTWQVVVNGNSYHTVTGQTDGKKTISKPTFCEAKNVGKSNETTAEEQAVLEATSKWEKKSKTGYFLNLEEIDNKKYVEPMLAKNFNDRKSKIVYPVGVQIKYNGVRCVLTKDGPFSRKGEKFLSVPHIEKCFSSFFKEHPLAVLDGELFNESLRQNLNELVKLCRKTVHISEEDINKSKDLVYFYVYDGYNFGGLGKDEPYYRRHDFIKTNLKSYEHYKDVESREAKDESQVYNIYEQIISENHEGVIVRLLNSGYENKRSSNLLKLKPEDDDEATILDIIEGEGNWAGTGKKIQLEWKGKIFHATLKSTLEEGRDFLNKKSFWIGKNISFLYNGLTGLGVPNFARVDYNNCLKGDR